jgi:hypothetical protein
MRLRCLRKHRHSESPEEVQLLGPPARGSMPEREYVHVNKRFTRVSVARVAQFNVLCLINQYMSEIMAVSC